MKYIRNQTNIKIILKHNKKCNDCKSYLQTFNHATTEYDKTGEVQSKYFKININNYINRK